MKLIGILTAIGAALLLLTGQSLASNFSGAVAFLPALLLAGLGGLGTGLGGALTGAAGAVGSAAGGLGGALGSAAGGAGGGLAGFGGGLLGGLMGQSPGAGGGIPGNLGNMAGGMLSNIKIGGPGFSLDLGGMKQDAMMQQILKKLMSAQSGGGALNMRDIASPFTSASPISSMFGG